MATSREDYADLAPLAIAFRAEGTNPRRPGELEALRALLGRSDLGYILVVRQAGRAVGCAALCWGYSIEYGGRDAFLDEIYLVPDERGRGLGRRMLDRLAIEARRAGAGAVHLELMPEDARAANLYLREGFADRGSRMLTRRLSIAADAATGSAGP